ncbi:nitrate- and nitrite sensing domain-containing protein [Saccharopolyspora erythraea]|uniref:sensor histidine kinase n=1 Tax=Saccharopolyspora erythraea TaxID=1836 RepID=UPI001BAE4137|nr:nitrate- and nitrite sensing domain-containing protein [Saccharopolyspora erythraea]QUG99909.1 nitrate- and nitrite sensing domain-containing protein [Saccharopolyspora erythraea]
MLNNDPGTGGRQDRRAEAQDPHSKRWWLRNWRLRTKMAAVLLVPTLAALGVGGVRVYDGMSTASRLNTIVEQVELAQRTADVTHELQRERDHAVVQTASGGADRVPYDDQARRVDDAIARFRLPESELEDFTPKVREAYESSVNRLSSLSSLRAIVNRGFTDSQTLVAYNSVVESVLNIHRAVSSGAANTQLTQSAWAAESTSRAKEYLAQQRSILLSAGIRNEFLTGQVDQMREADARFEAAFTEFENVASPAQRELYAARVAGAAVDDSEQIKQYALINAENDRALNMNPGEWGAASGARGDLLRGVEEEVLGEFHDSAKEYADAAWWAMLRDGALIVLLLLVAFAVASFIARSMLRPLRTLRYGALEIAEQSLPQAIKQVNENPGGASSVTVPPVQVHTREEIGQVARSFDAVHQQALRLASEQALLRTNVNDLFVNLARRSQTLVQRQLSLIDRLEQDEQDPDQLSSLFELDHLATRMRRNNENLLILGGTDLTRRMMRPVPLSEVVGAAVSEVEQYARIAIAESPELAIQGRVVNDFVHLIAELLENATVFSNPDTEVTVRTAYRRQELVIEIRDRGVGIDDEEIDEINDRLTRPPEVDVAVSRRMGLFVVGQLARRHNIGVQLQNNGDLEGGVTATVHLSGEYVVQLTSDGPRPMPDIGRPVGGDEPRRDPLSETGTHLGLAAAFGGRGGPADRGVDAPTERAPLPPLNYDSPSAPAPSAPAPSAPAPSSNGFDPSGGPLPQRRKEIRAAQEDEEQETPQEPVEDLPGNYSFQVSSGGSFGATDIPKWEDDAEASTDDEVRAEQWPSVESAAAAQESEIPAAFDGQCGVPAQEEEESRSLFHSPFEAEKTAQFEPTRPYPDSDGADQNGTRPAPDAPLAAGATQDVQDDPGGLRAATASDYETEGQPPAVDTQPKGASWDMDDAPTQRLPIYEAVLSQWFRESEGDESGTALADSLNAGGGQPPRPARQETPAEPPSVADGEQALQARRAAEPESETGELRVTGASKPGGETGEFPEELLAPTGPRDPGWGSADVGWQAAEALVQQSQHVQETTSAGLPKRVPKSNLVPGSAAPRPQSPAPAKPATTRSPDAVRGRMSNFQQGIRRGRHAKADPVSTEPPRSIPSRHEEQE